MGLFSNFALGWEVKFHGMFKEKKNGNGKPWYIPGYGISLYYTIPLNHDRWPVKDDKKGNVKKGN